MTDLPVVDRIVMFSAQGGERVLDVDWPVASAADLSITRTRSGVTQVLVYLVDYTVTLLASSRGATVRLALAAQAGDLYDVRNGLAGQAVPVGVMQVTITGGTANAIVGTTPVHVPSRDLGVLLMLTPNLDSMGDVTLVLNGADPVSILNADDSELEPGALQAGLASVLYLRAGAYRRLIGEGDIGASVAAAEAAAAAAEASADRVDLGALDTAVAATAADALATAADRSAVAADKASAASYAAAAGAGVDRMFADTAAGLAGTSNGQYFSVPSTVSGETALVYRNNAGSAQLIKRLSDPVLATARNLFPDPYWTRAGGDSAALDRGMPFHEPTYNNRVWVPDYAHSMGRGAWLSQASSATPIGLNTRWHLHELSTGDSISLAVIVKAAAGTNISFGARFFQNKPPTWVGDQFGTQTITATGGEDLVTVSLTAVPAGATGVCLYFNDGAVTGDFYVLAHWCNLNAAPGVRPPARTEPFAMPVRTALGDFYPGVLEAVRLASDIGGSASSVTTVVTGSNIARNTDFGGWGDVYTTPISISFNAIKLPVVGRGPSAPKWQSVHVVVRTHATAPQNAGTTVVAVGSVYIDPDVTLAQDVIIPLRHPSTGALLTVTEAALAAEFMVAYYVRKSDGAVGVCNDVTGSGLSGIARAGRSYYVLNTSDPIVGAFTTYTGNPTLAISLLSLTSPTQTLSAKPRSAFKAALGIDTIPAPLVAPSPTTPILAPRVFGIVGREMNIYLADMHSGMTRRLYDVTCTLGQQQTERWTHTPVATADNVAWSILVQDADHLATLGSGSCTIDVASATAAAGAAKRLLCIGDSTTAAGTYTQRMLDVAALNGSAVQPVLMGTLGTGANKHEGRGGWTMDAYFQQATYNSLPNPFYGSGGKFHFAEYLAASSQAEPNAVLIHLGINDVAGHGSDAGVNSRMDTVLDQLRRIIGLTADANVGAIHEVSAGIAVIVALPIAPAASQDAFGANYQNGIQYARYNRNIKLAAYRIKDSLSGLEASKVFLLPWHVTVDPVFGFPSATGNANATVTDQVRRLTNSVHPNTAGYNQMGDAAYACLNWLTVKGHI